MPNTKLSGLEIVLDGDVQLEENSIHGFVSRSSIKNESGPLLPIEIFLVNREFLSSNTNTEETVKDENMNIEVEVKDENVKSEENCQTMLSCDQCGFVTSQANFLDTHKKLKIHGVGNHVCEICGTMFGRLSELKIHREKFHEDSSFQCTECDYVARDSSSVKRHVRRTHSEKSFKCDACRCSFRTEKGMIKHEMLKHGTESDKPMELFKCELCDFKTTWSDNVKRHIESKHKALKHHCDKCSYEGNNLRSLKHHMKKHEGLVFSCENCPFISSTREKLYRHGRSCVVSSDQQQMFKCEECSFEYSAMWKLKRHTKDNHNDSWLFCDLCQFMSKSKIKIRNHKSSCHTSFVCHVCHKDEKSQYLIHKHIATAHTGDWSVPTKCDECDFVGRNERSLQYHKKKHEGKLYCCDKCPYTAPTKDQLRSHANSTHGELKLKCDFCDYKFPVLWRLKQHVQRRHSFPKPKKPRKRKSKPVEAFEDEEMQHLVDDQCFEKASEDFEVLESMTIEVAGAELDYALDHIVKTEDSVLFEISI